ncbi:hypothetical protein LJ655_03420 [Paraburkholderia sp. MMS20-SJTN17]|uniref:Uncharacterized protein n=1 Tax=Paraburkholderia translucens TaxID=2886945 RepID=A0ABS8K886_9BURK|nr:hypothetical protein [Paraburkholderia sp. MMS20-SJTN17]MCC8400950.1 hypothetical protein [Paraburkholderia sp. MMS20-SJTN17]
MCTCDELLGVCRYRSEAEYQAERARQAHAGRIEHRILAVLTGERIAHPSPFVMACVKVLRAQPDVSDIHVGGSCVWWWSTDGSQYSAQIDTMRPAIRLAA